MEHQNHIIDPITVITTKSINKDDDDDDNNNNIDNEIMISAASSALMGENIIDSPNARRSHNHKRWTTIPTHRMLSPTSQNDVVDAEEESQQQQQQQPTIVVPLPDVPNLNKNRVESTIEANTMSGIQNNHNQPNRASQSNTNNRHNNNKNNSNNNSALSVGIVAQGLAWAKQQKYKRQRQYLQYQAEQQLLKLQLATSSRTTVNSNDATTSDQSPQQIEQQQKCGMSYKDNNNNSNGRSLFFDPMSLQTWIQNLTSIPSLSTTTQSDNVESDSRVGRRLQRQTNSTEFSGHSDHPNGSVSSNTDNDENEDDENDYTGNNQFCSISQSGLGYSVELPKLFNPPPSHTTTTNSTLAKDNTGGSDDDDENDTSWIPQVRVEDATNYDDYSNIHSDHSNDDDDCTNNTQKQHEPVDDNNDMIKQPPEVYPPYLLSADEMYQIAVHVLPRNIVYCKWKRYYSLARDGDSFDNCLRQVQHCKQSLMIIRTTKNDRFGTYVDAPWDTTHSHTHGTIQYYGGPETCLFKMVQNPTDNTRNDDEKRRSKVVCYKWSGLNRYIQLCDHQNKMIAIGGGNGSFGLCIQQDFQYGSTGTCATFNNEPLCPDEQFSILDVEIYGFLLGQF